MSSSSVVRLIKYQFEYIITYHISPEFLSIDCVHLEENYIWKYTLYELSTYLEKNNSMNIKLNPKLLFDIFKSVCTSTLNPIYNLQFPKNADPLSELCVELDIILNGVIDTKILTFNPFPITEKERYNKKCQLLKRKYDNEVDSLRIENNEFQTQIDKLNTEINSLRDENTKLKMRLSKSNILTTR